MDVFQTILTYGHRVCTGEAKKRESSKNLAAAHCLAQMYPNCRTYVELVKLTDGLTRKEEKNKRKAQQITNISPPKQHHSLYAPVYIPPESIDECNRSRASMPVSSIDDPRRRTRQQMPKTDGFPAHRTYCGYSYI